MNTAPAADIIKLFSAQLCRYQCTFSQNHRGIKLRQKSFIILATDLFLGLQPHLVVCANDIITNLHWGSALENCKQFYEYQHLPLLRNI